MEELDLKISVKPCPRPVGRPGCKEKRHRLRLWDQQPEPFCVLYSHVSNVSSIMSENNTNKPDDSSENTHPLHFPAHKERCRSTATFPPRPNAKFYSMRSSKTRATLALALWWIIQSVFFSDWVHCFNMYQRPPLVIKRRESKCASLMLSALL